jgi:hypothetical protein
MVTLSARAAATSSNVRPQAYRPLGWRILLSLVGALSLALPLYFLVVWPWISRWGATNEEALHKLSGDELVANPSVVTTKAITINAPPQAVWPWLMQLGVDRGGMYSYLWVENWLLHLNVTNSDAIHPEWQDLQAGDFVRFTPKNFALNPGPGMYVVRMETNHALIGCFGIEGSTVDCNRSATWQFILTPQADHTTRLILRSRMAGPPSVIASLAGKLAYAPQFYMERKMLLGIKQRAEMFNISQILPSLTVKEDDK